MHEMSIVEALLEQVEKEVRAAGHPGRVTRLELVIGRLSGVNVDSIRFAFELLASGTLAEGAELTVAEPRALAVCHCCHARTAIEELTAACPLCGGERITIEGGRELVLQSIELTEPPREDGK